MNAKEEFLSVISGKTMIAAEFQHHVPYAGGDEGPDHAGVLKPGYSQAEYESFLNALDFEYDNGYGQQELEGTIWFVDGWAERAEYDGAEWWAHRKCPQLPH